MYPNTFYRVSVKALIRDSDNNILVLKENQDTWSLPGGGLDHGEKPEDGIKRELKEELGITNVKFNSIHSVTTFWLESKQAWLLWVVYDVIIDSNEFILGNKVTAVDFINPETFKSSEDIFEQQVYKVADILKHHG